MNTTRTLTALTVILASAIAASAAVVVNVGWHLNTATGWETSAESLLDDIVDSGFDFDGTVNSPDEIAISDFISDNAIFSVFMIEGTEGETFALNNLFVEYTSDDQDGTFDLSDNYGDANYDSALIRGWDSGGEVADETDGSTAVTRILGYGIGVSFDDTQANWDYFEGELTFEVEARYQIFSTQSGGIGIGELGEDRDEVLVNEVPEPATLAMLTVGATLVLARRRR